MRCGDCDKTDGLCYASLPPKVKCTVTGEYHLYDDECTIRQQPNYMIPCSQMSVCGAVTKSVF